MRTLLSSVVLLFTSVVPASAKLHVMVEVLMTPDKGEVSDKVKREITESVRARLNSTDRYDIVGQTAHVDLLIELDLSRDSYWRRRV